MKRLQQQSLLSFRKTIKKNPQIDELHFVPISDSEQTSSARRSEVNVEHYVNNASEPGHIVSNTSDIGFYAGNYSVIKELGAEDKISVFSNLWKPNANYKFPIVYNSINKHARSFQIKWLDEYE